MRRFSAWLAEEGEIGADELVNLKPPKLDTKVVDVLTEDQLRALLRACVGPEFRDRRDDAIVRLMIETGARAGEIIKIETADLNLPAGQCIVQCGKGGRGRTVLFGPHAARALDRYVRVRRSHRLADTFPRLVARGPR